MANTEKNKKSVILTVGSALVGLAFLAAGGTKLAGLEQHVQSFNEFGMPIWMMYAIGLAEVVGGGLLMVSRVRFVAAGALAGIMVGAVGTHLIVGHGAETVPAFVLLVAVGAIAYATREQLSELLGHWRQRADA